jgi:hypothetical protein
MESTMAPNTTLVQAIAEAQWTAVGFNANKMVDGFAPWDACKEDATVAATAASKWFANLLSLSLADLRAIKDKQAAKAEPAKPVLPEPPIGALVVDAMSGAWKHRKNGEWVNTYTGDSAEWADFDYANIVATVIDGETYEVTVSCDECDCDLEEDYDDEPCDCEDCFEDGDDDLTYEDVLHAEAHRMIDSMSTDTARIYLGDLSSVIAEIVSESDLVAEAE